jgi:hypothetical protein
MSGILVIDEDRPDVFAKYAADNGYEIPETFVVKTANGRHYYFNDTEGGDLGNHEGALKEYGINVRSGDAYVVGPGSVHEDGFIYEIEVDAGSLLGRNLPRFEAEELMRLAWARCDQPPDAPDYLPVEVGIEKLNRYEPGPSEGYGKAGESEEASPEYYRRQEAVKHYNRIKATELAAEWIAAEKARVKPEPQMDDLLEEEDETPDYRIDGLWPSGGRIVFSAQYKTGKTTMVGNVVRCLAAVMCSLGPVAVRSWLPGSKCSTSGN